MRKYTLDTNLYIRAIHEVEAAEELQSFYATFAPATYLNSIVLHELLVGATTPSKARGDQRTGRLAVPADAADPDTERARMGHRGRRDRFNGQAGEA